METKTIFIDVIQNVLQSPVAVGRYRGEEVCRILEDEVKNIKQASLLVVDMRKANPLQYNFCQYAFGPLLQKLQHDKSIPIIFQMHGHHKPCFFRGVIKYIDISLPRNESEKAFIESGLFTMILLEGENEIQYISRLSSLESEILSFVNETISISQREIIETKKEFQPEDIIDSLRSLDNKGFLLHLSDGNEEYHSVYQYLKDKFNYENK